MASPSMSDLENRFTYHKPFGSQPKRYESIRAKAKELAILITELTPHSREQSLALTKLEECSFWANASIARNEIVTDIAKVQEKSDSDFEPTHPPSPYELARRMLNEIGWDGNDFRLRDKVALAIAPEVERINRRATYPDTIVSTPAANPNMGATDSALVGEPDSPVETFTPEQVEHAIRSFLSYGEDQYGKSQHGFFSGQGFAGRALRFHLSKFVHDNKLPQLPSELLSSVLTHIPPRPPPKKS